MRHTIRTTVNNSPTGIPGNEDGVMMMVIQGSAASTGTQNLVLDTAYLGNKLDDFVTGLGITPDYDVVNGCNVYQHVKEFYEEAGDGASLWLVVTSPSNAFATYCAGTTFKNNIRGTIQSDITKRVKMIGICLNPPTSLQSASDFDSDVIATIPVLQATSVAMAAEGFPFSSVLDGSNMSSTVTASTIATVATKSAPSVSLCITGSRPNGCASVGAALGRFARITVGRGFGATEDGPIAMQTSYLTNGVSTLISGATISAGTALTANHSYMVLNGPVTYNGAAYSFGSILTCVTGITAFTGGTVVDVTSAGTIVAASKYLVLAGPVVHNSITYQTGQSFVAANTSFTGGFVTLLNATDVTKLFLADIQSFGDKQFMFHCPFYQLSGLYWNDGATCDLETKPLSTQEFNRVANKMSSALLNFLSLLKGVNVPVDKKTSLVSLSYTSAKQEDFYRKYINPLILSSDISDGSLSLTGTPNGSNAVNWTYVLTINGQPITGSATGEVVFTIS